jgi:uncharacterized protein YaiI (UPF0178 family)
MTINSSINNIKSKDFYLSEQTEENQDLTDYKVMQSAKDKNGNLVINEGLSLVNRYLNNGLLEFDDQGNIPTRQIYFNNILKNNVVDTQTVIKDKFVSTTQFLLSDYLSVNLH